MLKIVQKVDRNARPIRDWEIYDVVETEPDEEISVEKLRFLETQGVEFVEDGYVQHNGRRSWFCLKRRRV